MKAISVLQITFVKHLVPGVRVFPFEFGLMIMLSFSSKKWCLRLPRINKSFYGFPNISIIKDSWSDSLSPGNNGYPVNSSTSIQPKLHMSIDPLNFNPSITSGAL